MTREKISEYDAVASNNTDVNGVNIAENCPPSGMNNMGREIMAALKRFQVGSDGDGVTVGGNLVVSGTSTLSTTSISSADINAGTIDGTAIGGSTPAAVSATTLNTSGAVVFNDAGANVDFRVEGDTNANLLFVDASADAVGIGTSSPAGRLHIKDSAIFRVAADYVSNTYEAVYTETSTGGSGVYPFNSNGNLVIQPRTSTGSARDIVFATGSNTPSTRAVITSGGDLLVGKTDTTFGTAGVQVSPLGFINLTRDSNNGLNINRLTNDGTLVEFYQAGTLEGSISVSGNTVSYNAFSGGHWTQLPEGRGYNPDIPRGTVMSTIGEMCEWKSVEWTETTEHPAIPAVEAKEAVLDEEGNVIEPAVEAVEGKDAWTETSDKRETYLGDLPVGATFEEDGFTKTVVDDGNERLPKVKISDVVGDKAVYGVFQTWDEAQDMLVTSLGAFVVRIAAGVTVEIGDLLESNGDGCAKVQDDDVIRSKTIAKVTSTTPTATYDDGSYTVPAVIYCG